MEYEPKEKPVQQMQGYSNLTLVKEKASSNNPSIKRNKVLASLKDRKKLTIDHPRDVQ